MASDSDTKVPTQQSVKAYADTKITGSTGGVDGVMLVADGTGGKTAKAHASGRRELRHSRTLERAAMRFRYLMRRTHGLPRKA